MLGTLVAIAVARMRSLETFIWDMPTGILRDVWLALSSLGDREDGKPCKLEKVWVRWHDNTSTEAINAVPPPLPLNLPPGHPHLHSAALHPSLPSYYTGALTRVEHPSFSVLPPLKSLSVLDIDELAYLDEMAVLIGRSVEKLRELRVGIARHAMTRDWVTVWDGDSVHQVDREHPVAGSLTIGEKRLGGVLGALTGFVYDMRRPRFVLPERTRQRRSSSRAQAVSPDAASPPPQATSPEPPAANPDSLTSFSDVIPEAPGNEAESSLALPPSSPVTGTSSFINNALAVMDGTATSILSGPEPQEAFPPSPIEDQAVPRDFLEDETPPLNNVLRLENLELERVPLSVPVLQKVIDWTRLTSITLLHCPNHEQLWKTLRKQFAPTTKSPAYPSPRRSAHSTPRKGKHVEVELEYKLNLKKIHTNTVSPALITFTKETLAPNSLEVLFLQEARSYVSAVQVDTIFRGPMRRHRGSLKKLLIDSSEKSPDSLHANSSRWRRWMLNREVLAFICSGKMPALRELGMAIDYRDWVSNVLSTFYTSLS